MRKIVCLLVFVLNIFPFLKDGEIGLLQNEVFGQFVPGGVYEPGNNGNITYIGQGVGSSWSGSSNVYYYNLSNGSYTVYSIYDSPNGGIAKGRATLQGIADPDTGDGAGGGSEDVGSEGDADPNDGLDDDIDMNDDGGWSDPREGTEPPAYWDCNGDLNGTAYMNDCNECVGGRTGNVDMCNLPTKLYITLNDYQTKYYNKDSIFVPRGTTIKLTIHNENGAYDPASTEWKRKDSSKCNNSESCTLNIGARGITLIKFDSAGKTVIRCHLVVYDPPVVYFTKGSNYKGEFGFDDFAHEYLKDSVRYKAGYSIRKFGKDTAYKIPWVSLLDNQSISLTARFKKDNGDSAWASRDVNSEITVSSANDKFLVYGSTLPYTIKYSSFYTKGSMPILGKTTHLKTDSLKLSHLVSFIGINNDTLGGFLFSCSNPVYKKMLIVYVKTDGSGYRNISKSAILDSLNRNSHNQLFRQWVNYVPTQQLVTDFGQAIVDGMDTLDLTAEFTANPNIFMHQDTLKKRLNEMYENHKNGLSLRKDVNENPNSLFKYDPGKVHVAFIYNYALPSSTLAAAEMKGYKAQFWNKSGYKTFAHEMGHILSLDHIFPEWDGEPPKFYPGYNIPKHSSLNFMDYALGTDLTEMFFYAQWITVF